MMSGGVGAFGKRRVEPGFTSESRDVLPRICRPWALLRASRTSRNDWLSFERNRKNAWGLELSIGKILGDLWRKR